MIQVISVMLQLSENIGALDAANILLKTDLIREPQSRDRALHDSFGLQGRGACQDIKSVSIIVMAPNSTIS